MSRISSYIFIWISIALGITLGVLMTMPPKTPGELSLKEFSVDHEKEHIRQLAQNPHSIGTAEHNRVREYILGAFRDLQYSPETQKEQVVTASENGFARVVWTQNLMVRIPGRDSSGAILLMAHYDSVPDAPGANDDSAGVAAILEIMRILSVSPPPANDVIALITDAEEIGMLGAQVFFEQHPWAKDVSVVLNFEARGCTGASYMYETGPDNAWLVRTFARSASSPIANSLTHAIYQRMPNDSDFTLAKSAGLAGLNFAYIDGWQAYHTPLDNLGHLNDNTLYHHGSNVLQLVQTLTEMPLDTQPSGDAVYFSLWRPLLISYPISWAWPLTGLAVALFLVTLIVGFRKGQLSLLGILLGFLGFLATTAASLGLAFLLKNLILTRLKDVYSVASQYPDYRHVVLAAFLCLTFFLFFLIQGIFRKWANARSLAAGGLVWWALGTLAVTWYMPLGSFLLVWPLILASISLWIVIPREEPETGNPTRALFLGILLIPALILLIMLFVAFNTAFRPYPPSILIPAFLVGLLGPSLVWYESRHFWATSGIFLLLALGAAGLCLFGLDFDHRPLHQHIIYEQSDTQAFLALEEMTPWAVSQMADAEDFTYAPPSPLRGDVKRRAHTALGLPPPRIESVPTARGELRQVRLRIFSPRRAPVLGLHLAAAESFSLQLGSGGEKLFSTMRAEQESYGGKPHRLLLYLWALPHEGSEFRLETSGTDSIQVTCTDLSFDLPEGLELELPESEFLVFPRTLVRSQATIPALHVR
jgi:hypothetical protein